jgi:vacuolar-type H+-ATPase subunit E/Vma4
MNLEPLREALRAQAEADAGRRRTAVDEECGRRVADAEAQARSLVEQGRLEGEQAATREALRRRAAASRRARELRLDAQRSLLEELRLRARDAALERRAGPLYPKLLDRLSRAVRVQLGPDAALEIDPPTVGGVVGRADGRSVDYSLPALVERAIEDLDGRLDGLWR